MFVLRLLSLVFFLTLAGGLVAWQIAAQIRMSEPLGLGSSASGWILYGVTIGLGVAQAFVMARFDLARILRWVAAIVIFGGLLGVLGLEASERLFGDAGWGFLFPWDILLLALLFGAAMPLLLGRGEDLDAMGEKSGLAIMLLLLNVGLPILISRGLFPSEFAMGGGLSAIALLFFLFVDYYLIRALIHYFTSGATTFVSMRYLRKRPVSLASILGVASGICVLIVVNSIMNGFTSEYREQVRGTMSDVIIKLSPDNYYPSSEAVDAELWRWAFEKVQANERMRKQWEDALARAQFNMLDKEAIVGSRRGDYSLDESSANAFPALLERDPDQVTLEIDRLNSGSPLSDDRALLPIHPHLGVASPINIYMTNIHSEPADRVKSLDTRRAEISSALFLPNMKRGIAVLAEVAASQDTTEAYAPRLKNVTVLKTEKSQDLFQQAEITAVDPIGEPKISNMGRFVATAVLDEAREENALDPLINMINGLLLFEAPTPTSIARSLGPCAFDKNGILFVSHGPWRHYVHERGAIARNGALQWKLLDGITYRPDTPAAEIFLILRKAIKKAQSEQDTAKLREVITRTRSEVVEVLEAVLEGKDADALLKKLPKDWDSLAFDFGQRARPAPEEIPSNDTILAYYQEWYVRGGFKRYSEHQSRLYFWNKKLSTEFAPYSDDDFDYPSEELSALLDRLAKENKAALGRPFAAGTTIAEVNAYAQEVSEKLAGIIDPWLNDGDKLADLNTSYRSAASYLTGFRRSLELSDATSVAGNDSLARVVDYWDERWASSQAYARAYEQILPLRTFLINSPETQESVEEYWTRARASLAYRADGAGWQDNQAEFDRAKEGAKAIILDNFLRTRILRQGDGARELTSEDAEAHAALFESVEAIADRYVSRKESEPKQPKKVLEAITINEGVPALEDALREFRREVEAAYSDYASDKDLSLAVSGLFDVVRNSQRYWRLRPIVPGVIVGGNLANSIGADVDSKLQAHILRITRNTPDRGSATSTGPSHSFRTGEETFRVTAHFKSGLYAANNSSIFGDFETWMGLYGASRAEYQLSIKLKDYDASMHVDPIVVAAYRSHLIDMRDDLPKDSNGELKRYSSMSDRERAIWDGWKIFPEHHTAGDHDRTSMTTWEEETAGLLSAVEREKEMLTLLLGLIVVLAGVVILIVVYLTVVEKVKDIGILKAMGASPWGVRSIFMFNALYIGVFGTFLGAGLAYVISENLNQIEDWIEMYFGVRLFPPDIYYLTYIPSVKGWDLFVLARDMAVPTTLWAFFCGIGPALIASKKNTVEALQYE